MTQHDLHGNMNACFEVPSNVYTLFPNVNCHFRGVALRCVDILDDDMARHSHNLWFLGDADHGVVACLQHPTCNPYSILALVYR